MPERSANYRWGGWRIAWNATSMVQSACALRHATRLEYRMQTVTVSPKFQVVIPRAVREPLGIRPGQKLQVIRYGNRIEFVPLRSLQEMRGFIKGVDTTIEREPDRI